MSLQKIDHLIGSEGDYLSDLAWEDDSLNGWRTVSRSADCSDPRSWN
jgi:hypothetical protein